MSWIKMTKDTLTHIIESLAEKIKAKQDTLTFDTAPQSGSTNPVTSGGVYNSLSGKMNSKSIDSSPTSESTNLVTSGGVYSALSNKQNKVNGVSDTEIKYLDGVTTYIQDQLNSLSDQKQAKLTFDSTPVSGSSNPVTSGGVYTALSGKQASISGGASTIASSNLTSSRALISNSSGKVAVSAVTSTELGYLDGVTSNIQSQLNAKSPTIKWAVYHITGTSGNGDIKISITKAYSDYYWNGEYFDLTSINANSGTRPSSSSMIIAIEMEMNSKYPFFVSRRGGYSRQVWFYSTLKLETIDQYLRVYYV